jgi:hypothetical protein
MRVVLDTNILVSALLVQKGYSGVIYRAWQEHYFTLLTCAEQLDELRAALHKPALAALIKPYKAGRLINELKDVAETIRSLPRVERSPDPGKAEIIELNLIPLGPEGDHTMRMSLTGIDVIGH